MSIKKDSAHTVVNTCSKRKSESYHVLTSISSYYYLMHPKTKSKARRTGHTPNGIRRSGYNSRVSTPNPGANFRRTQDSPSQSVQNNLHSRKHVTPSTTERAKRQRRTTDHTARERKEVTSLTQADLPQIIDAILDNLSERQSETISTPTEDLSDSQDDHHPGKLLMLWTFC